MDTASLSRHTRDYLAAAEKAGRVVTVTGELPKSFIVTTGESPAVYISQISAGTLKKRSGYVDGISNIENREPPENKSGSQVPRRRGFLRVKPAPRLKYHPLSPPRPLWRTAEKL